MILTMEQSIVRQLEVYKQKVRDFKDFASQTKNKRFVEQMERQIEKQMHKIKEVTRALAVYREHM